LKLVIFFWRGR